MSAHTRITFRDLEPFGLLAITPKDFLHQAIKKLAKREGCSVNQFLARSASKGVTALLTRGDLRTEAAEAAEAAGS